MSLQLSAFNVLNQVGFDVPRVSTVGRTHFGSMGGVVDKARRAEIGVKL